jgi:putative nucleotidyltransferase with HDIG domain
MPPPTLTDLIEGMPKLGSYAGVLRELDAVLNNPHSTLDEICDVIEKDTALAAKLLKLANTCFFGFSRRIETVFETIGMIGIQQVRDLIAASTVIRLFSGVSSEFVDMESFWRHSLACAVAARILAISRQLSKPEKHFTAGLLHDIGRLVILSRLPEETAKIFQLYSEEKLLLREAEKKVLGYDHTEIGAALLQSWSYPFSLVHAVRFHHFAMASGAFQVEASIIHVADHLINAMGLGGAGERWIPPLNMKVWERLDLPLEVLGPAMSAIDEQYLAVEKAFLPTKAELAGS